MWCPWVPELEILVKNDFSFVFCFAHFGVHQWLQIRVQAIRGLPLLCKDTPEYVPKIVDVLGQLLEAGNFPIPSFIFLRYLVVIALIL